MTGAAWTSRSGIRAIRRRPQRCRRWEDRVPSGRIPLGRLGGTPGGRGGLAGTALRRGVGPGGTWRRAWAPRNWWPRCPACCNCAAMWATPCCTRLWRIPLRHGSQVGRASGRGSAAGRRGAARPSAPSTPPTPNGRSASGRTRRPTPPAPSRTWGPSPPGGGSGACWSAATSATWSTSGTGRHGTPAGGPDDPVARHRGHPRSPSLSKRSNLAGVRAGFYSGDAGLMDFLSQARRHLGFMMPGPSQAAAAAALGDDEHVEAQRTRYLRRLDLLAGLLERLDLQVPLPEGAFYLSGARARRRRLGPGGAVGGHGGDAGQSRRVLRASRCRPRARVGHGARRAPGAAGEAARGAGEAARGRR